MFWIYVLAGFLVFCALLWWYDRRHAGRHADAASMRYGIEKGVGDAQYRGFHGQPDGDGIVS